MQAGQSGGGQQRGKAFFCLPGFERDTVEKQLVVRNAEQEAPAGKRALEFAPCGLELRLCAFVLIAVHPRILNEDVQTVNKCPCRSCTRSLRCACAGDKELLELRISTSRLVRKSKL